MSNDVRNTLTVSGKAKATSKFRSKDPLAKLLKQHAHSFEVDFLDGKVLSLEFGMTSPNAPLVPRVVTACLDNPDLDFQLRWHSPNDGRAGRLNCSIGRVTEQIEFSPLIRGRQFSSDPAVEVISDGSWPPFLTTADLDQIRTVIEVDQLMREPVRA